MKKLLHMFIKPHKSKHKYSFCGNDLHQSDSNVTSSQTDIYKNVQFDSYTFSKNEESNEKTQTILNENQVYPKKISQLSCENIINGVLNDKSKINKTSSISSDKSFVERNFEEGNKHKNNYQLVENGRKNSKNSTYVISISNSQNFCIGSQKTVYVNDIIKGEVINNVLDAAEENCWETLLNSDKKLTESDIHLISQHIDDNWKEFMQSLGIEESLVKNTIWRNNNNKTLIVYDLLMKYLNNFPNTSVGFVANVLKNNNQVNVMTKLSQK